MTKDFETSMTAGTLSLFPQKGNESSEGSGDSKLAAGNPGRERLYPSRLVLKRRGRIHIAFGP